jgi:hypothetical protein
MIGAGEHHSSQEFVAKERSKWSAVEDLRLEANRIMQRDAKHRDQLFQDLFRFVGFASLLSPARIGIDFILPGNYLLDTRLTVYLGIQTEMAEELLSRQLTNCVK